METFRVICPEKQESFQISRDVEGLLPAEVDCPMCGDVHEHSELESVINVEDIDDYDFEEDDDCEGLEFEDEDDEPEMMVCPNEGDEFDFSMIRRTLEDEDDTFTCPVCGDEHTYGDLYDYEKPDLSVLYPNDTEEDACEEALDMVLKF